MPPPRTSSCAAGSRRGSASSGFFQDIERENQLILRAAGDGIYGVNAEGKTTFVNPAAERMLGWAAEELVGKAIHPIVHHSHHDGSHYPDEDCPIYAAFRDGVVRNVDGEVFWRKDGSPVWVEYTSTPIRDRGTVVGAVIVFRDVSQRREADEKLHAALAEVDRLRERLELENAYLQEEIRIETNPRGIIGQSAAIQKTLRQVKLVAPTTAAVMITGESGTGKELIARAIHEASSRARPAADPRQLRRHPARAVRERVLRPREGRLHRRAARPHRPLRAGRRRHAVPRRGRRHVRCELQGKLLRVLQEGNFERVGEERTRAVDVRLIAATNRNLKQEVARGRFREDLYFRLNVFPVESVPLRDRREDIPLLAQHFLMSESKELKSDLRLSEGDARRLQRYDWPGNVRELQNVIERAAILAQNGRLRIDLPDTSGLHAPSASGRQKADATARGDDRRRVARPRARQYPGGACRLQRQGVRPRRRRSIARHQADHAGLAHEGAGPCPCPRRQALRLYDDFRILKLLRYSSGFAASKVLPITANDLYAVAGGVSPISFITLAVSVARKTCSATDL